MFLTLKILTIFCVITLANYSSSTDVALGSFGLSAVLGDKEYYIGATQKVNWYRAAQICSAIGMSLTSIESEKENDNLSSYLFSNSLLGEQFWLSGTDLGSASEYIWLASGKKFKYTLWAAGQPTANNRCVRTNDAFRWVTANCADSNYFICSRPTVPACGIMGRCRYSYYPL